MNPLGNQHIAEFINCSPTLLNNKNALEKMFREGIKTAGLELITITAHKFDPIGVTVVAVIGESHIAIHTYPEAKHASLDIFTCCGTTKKHDIILKFFKETLKPKNVRYLLVERGNPLEVKQVDWTSSFSSYGFEVKYHIKKRVAAKKSQYQQIEIIENENFGRMLFLDKDLQISEADTGHYDASLVNPILKRKKKLNEVCIMGGGDGGVLHALLKGKPKKAYLVDIDRDVIALSKKYLPKICGKALDAKNAEIVVSDVNAFLPQENKFDAIIYDLTMHPETILNVQRVPFLRALFKKIAISLTRGGMVTMQAGSEHDGDTTKLLKKMLPQYFKNITFERQYIPSFCEFWMFCSAVKR